jgi:hypothetical protein
MASLEQQRQLATGLWYKLFPSSVPALISVIAFIRIMTAASCPLKSWAMPG